MMTSVTGGLINIPLPDKEEFLGRNSPGDAGTVSFSDDTSSDDYFGEQSSLFKGAWRHILEGR
jgi:hypothetical protein